MSASKSASPARPATRRRDPAAIEAEASQRQELRQTLKSLNTEIKKLSLNADKMLNRFRTMRDDRD